MRGGGEGGGGERETTEGRERCRERDGGRPDLVHSAHYEILYIVHQMGSHHIWVETELHVHDIQVPWYMHVHYTFISIIVCVSNVHNGATKPAVCHIPS